MGIKCSTFRRYEEFAPQKDFFSYLLESDISDDEYRHAQEVFTAFQCKHIHEYCDLYCKLDTILLGEIMRALRPVVLKDFTLDCLRYISLPQLTWDAMLRTLEEPIDYMTDPDMILMCEQNIRGGVSFVSERIASSPPIQPKDNISTREEIDNFEDQVQDNLLYVDANNRYSLAQSQPMPARDFKWCSSEELNWLKDSNNLFIIS